MTVILKKMYNKNLVKKISEQHSNKKIGWICSCWDLLHPGHANVLKDAKSQCDLLVVGLHVDPNIERPNKNKPVQSLVERRTMIESIKYVDFVIEYETEADHYEILKSLPISIRILGDDYFDKSFTGDDLPISIYFHKRTQGLSTSDLRKKIFNLELNKQMQTLDQFMQN